MDSYFSPCVNAAAAAHVYKIPNFCEDVTRDVYKKHDNASRKQKGPILPLSPFLRRNSSTKKKKMACRAFVMLLERIC
jgi:hypothetical protein